jgi:predicted RNase H-like nuclease (RuvC/YqgF family)
MTEVKRYTASIMHPGVREDPEGLLVAYRHYEELKAEVTNLKAEADRFKAKLERLTQAGDAMQTRLNFFQKRWDNNELCEEAEAWNAAKEGKQS